MDTVWRLYVDVLILLSCLGWMALVFWGAIWVGEKICRIVYQDLPQPPPVVEIGEPAECRDCGGTFMLDAEQRCDLCVSIERGVIDHYGFGSVPPWASPDEATHMETIYGPHWAERLP